MENQTIFTQFLLLGLSSRKDLQLLLFGIFFIVYLMTLIGNLIIIVLIWVDLCLHKPMYFFLSNLSFLDICYSSVSVPKMLTNLLAEKKVISLWGCVAQLFGFSMLVSAECLILSVMAYDRYVAICKPLLYPVIMNSSLCIRFALSCWLTGFVNAVIHTVFTFRLPFCSNKINHFLCEIPPLLKLACTSTLINEILLFALAGIISVGSFLLIVVSYTHIISTIMKIPSVEGRKKTFSTCASHLTVVTMLYASAIFVYMRPSSNYSLNTDKLISVLYTVIAPMLNPIIYSMRNVDVKIAFRKTFTRKAPLT
ncbi:olfactory receptor 5V1-like [Ascaphus truei]|uniref:olfactory receptor 5V1-like n=1 Tax=Ascaphus truei TaxID=8439 RepID=UPI003F5A624C